MSSDAVLGFDYGLRRVGVAMGDIKTGLSFPLLTLDTKDLPLFWNKMGLLFKEWKPLISILGLPGNSHIAWKVREFGKLLEEKYQQTIVYISEDYTSFDAESFLKEHLKLSRKNKKLIDKHAATLILECYFSSLSPKNPT